MTNQAVRDHLKTANPLKPIIVLAGILLVFAGPPAWAQSPVTETLTIPEVVEQAMVVDQKRFRLKFYYRDNIQQLDAERYYCRLFDLDYSHIYVEFSKEGLNFFKRVASEEDSYEKFRRGGRYSSSSPSSIYVQARQITTDEKPQYWVDYTINNHKTPLVILDAFGRSVSKNISGEPTYRW
jgi:hypothetical protein